MRPTPPAIQFSELFRSRDHGGAIEWEELPSLANSISGRLALHSQSAKSTAAARMPVVARVSEPASSAWDATRPAALDTSPPEQPFFEPVQGVALREVHAPEVFRHFFGS